MNVEVLMESCRYLVILFEVMLIIEIDNVLSNINVNFLLKNNSHLEK